MGSEDKAQKYSRAAIVVLAAAAVLVFALFEFPIMNSGRVGFHVFQPHFSALRIIFYLIVLGGILFFRKKIERFLIGNHCFQKTKLYFYGIFFAAALLGSFIYLYESRLFHKEIYSLIAASLLIVFIMWFVAILLLGEKPENNFLVIGLLIVSLFALLTKFNHGVDEASHFAEAYGISIGHIFNIKQNSFVPEAFLKLDYNIPFQHFIPTFQFYFDYENLIFLDPKQTGYYPAGYPAVFYLMPAAGLWIGRHLNFTVLSEYIIGRLFNCLAYILLCYLAVRIMPVAKNLFSVVLLTPFLCLLSSTYSIDGIGTAVVALFAALCFHYAYAVCANRELGLRDYVLIAVAALLVVLFKSHSYSAVLLLIFLIPLKKLLKKDGVVRAFKIIFPIFLVAFAFAAAFHLLHLPAQYSDPRGGGNVNAALQFRNVLKHPFFFIDVFLNWVRSGLQNGLISLSSHNYFFGPNCNLFVPTVLLSSFAAFTDTKEREKYHINQIKEKVLLLCSVLLTVGLIFLGLYMIFCNVGARTMHGLQPRYLFPLVPLVYLVLNGRSVTNKIRNYSAKISFCSSAILVISMFEMIIK